MNNLQLTIKPYQILLILSCFDIMIEGWFGIWYLKIFIEKIDVQMLSFTHILSSGLGIITMYWVIKKYEKPSISMLIIVTAVSYIGLFGLMISPSIFLIASTVLETIRNPVATSFRNNLIPLNVSHNNRAKFDNLQSLLSKICLIVGGLVAYFTIAASIEYWKIWLAVYILFDVDLIIKLLLIKKGIIAYN